MAINTDLNNCSILYRLIQTAPPYTDKPGIATKLEKMLSALPCLYNSHINITWSIKYNTYVAQDSQNNKTETK